MGGSIYVPEDTEPAYQPYPSPMMSEWAGWGGGQATQP